MKKKLCIQIALSHLILRLASDLLPIGRLALRRRSVASRGGGGGGGAAGSEARRLVDEMDVMTIVPA